MSNETNTPETVATFTDTVDGSNKTEPARMDGWTFKFPTIPSDASLEDATAFLSDRAENAEAAVSWLRDQWEGYCKAQRKSWHNAKAAEPGKTYTREERKALPQRSEVASQEDAQEFAEALQLPKPKVTPKDAARAAEERAKRAEAQAEAQTEALLETLRDLPKAKGAERLEALVAAGILPEGTEL